LKSPLLFALPVTVTSGDATVIVALAFAPLPSIVRDPEELSRAFCTLTAASALDGATNSAESVSSETNAATRRPCENRMLERFIPSSHERCGVAAGGCRSRSRPPVVQSFHWLLRRAFVNGFHI
jgi:hypothetical protein